MNLEKINTKAPQPYMYTTVAPLFDKLRIEVYKGSGVDFLAVCGDVLRDPNFMSNKDGVANRSNHKTGRAFDYDQTSKHILIQKELIAGKMFFRTYIKCSKQDGTLGIRQKVLDFRGIAFNGYVFDFTKCAESYGFVRIPAWNGWQNSYNRMEFWHYQKMNGLTWDEAMLALKGKARTPDTKVYGLNDRGEEVKAIQKKLAELGILPVSEVDGIFGKNTFVAVKQFQKERGFTSKNIDGIVGPMTRKELFKN